MVQYKILTEILEKIEIPNYIHAFEKGRSIPSMAALHVGKRVVLSLDLKDFFGSIKQYHLEQLFTHLGFGIVPARTLSELCTFKAQVPQGALTSPKVSNIITALTFGPVIKDYCDTKGYTLSIYADDITISSENKFDGENNSDTVSALIQFISQTVRQFSFRINRDKTKLMSKNQRQYVCGTVVNDKVNLIKSERHLLRAIIHNCEVNGLKAEAEKNNQTVEEFFSRIMGRCNWWVQLNPSAGEKYKEKLKLIYAEYLNQPIVMDENVNKEEALGIQIPVATESSVPW